MTEAKRAFAARDLRNLIVLFFGGPLLAIALGAVSILLHGWFRTGLGTLSGIILLSYVERVNHVSTTEDYLKVPN